MPQNSEGWKTKSNVRLTYAWSWNIYAFKNIECMMKEHKKAEWFSWVTARNLILLAMEFHNKRKFYNQIVV